MGFRGAPTRSLRVAIIGSGPAGFFAAEKLFARSDLDVSVDMFERLPMPFGLVRFGVAPDHPKIKGVVRKFEKIAEDPRFRFFGNVEFGATIGFGDLLDRYHAVCIATGTPSSRSLGIPGEELARSHAATEFVAWYNGHPDYRNRRYDLSVEKVAVVGIGNVALDVARMFCRTADELARTDIADHALEAFRHSRVREVVLLGRRGPAQAAFTNPEIKELAAMESTDFVVRPEDIDLDEASRLLDSLRAVAERGRDGRPRRLTLRFCVSPVELVDDGAGRVGGVRLVRNRLERNGEWIRAVPTEEFEQLDAGLVFRAAGYRGLPLPGVPFNDARGVLPNEKGRVTDGEGGPRVPGLYVAGWIKRGPSGVIGTNKPDSAETIECLLEDHAEGRLDKRAKIPGDSMADLLFERHVRVITYDDWKRIDALETARGERVVRPRVKITSLEECLAVLDGTRCRPGKRNYRQSPVDAVLSRSVLPRPYEPGPAREPGEPR